MIKIQNLHKNYGESVIFENASFSFPDKGLICILGPSGCGKSTLLNLMAGFDSDYTGEIFVHGSLLSQMSPEELCDYRRDNVGFIFQNYHLIRGYTALENICLASDAAGRSRSESEGKAKKLLERLGISDKAEQKIDFLSGGEKQRVAIARAIINNPSVILADEPTGALDRKNSDEIMKLLKTMAETRLVIVITHDKKCAEYAEQTVTISDGQLLGTNPSLNLAETAVLKTKKAPKLPLHQRAFKNISVHFLRYMAIALSVSIGVLCFSLSLSSGNIMQKSIDDFEAKNTAYHNGYIKLDENQEEVLSLLGNDERLENIYLQYRLENISVKIGEQQKTIEEKYPMSKATEKISYGVMPRSGENEIAISPSLAAKFEKNIQNLIGKTAEVIYNGQTFYVTVSGIFNAVYDDFFISSDIERKMYDGMSEKAYSVSYDVTEFEKIPLVSRDLKTQGLNSQNASSEVENFLKTFKNLNRLFLTVSILIFVISVFIGAIVLIKQQNTRYREVGLLSALGYKKENIRKILFYENLCLAVISGLFGGVLVIMAGGIGRAAGFSLVFTLPQMLMTFGLSVVLMLIISFLSGIQLINTEPAQALRK